MDNGSKYEKMFFEKMDKVGAVPYRVGGRFRAAFTPDTPAEVVEQMKSMVKVMAKHVAEKLPEPDGEVKRKWAGAGLKQLDVCDEPCPEGVLLTECPTEWLVARCARYHFDLKLTDADPPKLTWVPHPGWQMDDREVPGGKVSGVKSIMPGWFVDACKRRKTDIIEFLKAKQGVRS